MTKRRTPLLGALLAATVVTSGCAVSPIADRTGRYAEPIGAAPVIDNATPYSATLACLSGAIAELDKPRLAVGDVRDYTGKSSDFGGAKLTQGAALMAMSALAQLGLPQVERLDMGVAERELALANNNLLSDAGDLRLIRAGSIPGSDYYLVGGITELNYNLRSVAMDAFYASGGVGGRLYVLNVAVDLRLVETKTLKVVDVIGYQKQILGREVRAGIFEFFGNNLFDLSLEERALEPMQLAVRAMIEKATGEMARRLFKLKTTLCAPSNENVMAFSSPSSLETNDEDSSDGVAGASSDGGPGSG